MLATDTALVKIDENKTSLETVPYTFSKPHLYNPARRWKNLQPVPGSDKIIIHDEGRLLVYNSRTKRFSTVPLESEATELYVCSSYAPLVHDGHGSGRPFESESTCPSTMWPDRDGET